jgi:hydroxymethylpyrimidine/phosphomethylpyrimidine kinase
MASKSSIMTAMSHSGMFVAPPVALTIAGSDCSAGAGLQADLKTFSALGVYGLTAVTCVVAEVPGRVTRIQVVEEGVISEQISLLLKAFPVAAVKTGMLFSAETVREVARALLMFPAWQRPRLVVDPVMIATSGTSLVQPDTVAAYREHLFPLAEVITPNLDEAASLLGSPIITLEGMIPAGQALAEQTGAAILMKGGHLSTEEAYDVLISSAGEILGEWSVPFVRGVSTHGTGCTYSAAIAAGLAQGLSLVAAVAEGKRFVTQSITHLCRWMPSAETERTSETIDALNHSALR